MKYGTAIYTQLAKGGATLKINKNVFKYIEHEMYCYDEIKKELELYREQIIEGENKPEVSVSGGTTGDQTANKAIKLVSSKFVLQSEKVIQAIEKTLGILGDAYKELFEYKYQKGLPWQEVMAEMCISERTYFRMRRNLVTMVGQQLGVLNIE